MDTQKLIAFVRPFLEKDGFLVVEDRDNVCFIGKETVCFPLAGGISKEAVLKVLPKKKESKSFYTTKHDKEAGGSASAWNSCLHEMEQNIKQL